MIVLHTANVENIQIKIDEHQCMPANAAIYAIELSVDEHRCMPANAAIIFYPKLNDERLVGKPKKYAFASASTVRNLTCTTDVR